MAADNKFMQNNLERLDEKKIQSNLLIEEKDNVTLDKLSDKRQLENVIIFLADKIKELKDERKPLEERKHELEKMI